VPSNNPPTSLERKTGIALSSILCAFLGTVTAAICFLGMANLSGVSPEQLYGFLPLSGFSLLCGMTAASLGVLALRLSRRKPTEHAGGGAAWTGCLLGILTSLFSAYLIMIAVVYPRQMAQSKRNFVACIANLQKLHVSVTRWADAHNETFPTSLQSITNDISSPTALFCPSDLTQSGAYQLLVSGIKYDDAAINKAIIRCPIHKKAILGDGSITTGNR
jgi:hypothetical protein